MFNGLILFDCDCRTFISMSPLLFISTSDAEGNCDVSPRGDEPGTVKVLNNYQLVIPDRSGNRRVDSMMNILSNPHISILFTIPGREDVLRINGRAYIIKNKEILSTMSLKNHVPLLRIGIDVDECYFHCPRALKTSNIWNPETWNNTDELPTSMKIFRDHLKINGIEHKE
jgi:uncharacterized protein